MRPRVLIVEDEMIMALSLREMLEDWGYSVLPLVASGETGVARAAEERPDLVLMDISLFGEMDGIEAARKIITRYGIPVIFMSGYADGEIVRRATALNPAAYLIKPLNFRELRDKIETALKDKD
jgi:CheY-like chemotaxis protein